MIGPNSNPKTDMKKGPWTREEDQKLLTYIKENGHGSWRTLPTKAGLQRCGKSCRLRWTNYLRPDIKIGKFSTHEEKAIIRLHALLGNRWSAIAAHLPKRTDNEIKNYWNTRLKKRLTRMGIDPATHKPRNNPAGSAQSAHMAQWEAARLEAEARLARESKLKYKLPLLRKMTAAPPLRLAPPPCLDVLKVWQSTAIPSCFFSYLESPTSTLNFSPSSLAVPAVSPIVANDDHGAWGVGPGDSYTDDRILYDPSDYDCELMGALDLASFTHDSDVGGPLVEDFEDSKNYWDYLLNMVSSPMMEPPGL